MLKLMQLNFNLNVKKRQFLYRVAKYFKCFILFYIQLLNSLVIIFLFLFTRIISVTDLSPFIFEFPKVKNIY